MNIMVAATGSGGITSLLQSAGLSGVWPSVIDYAARVLLIIVGFFICKLIIKLIVKGIIKWLEKKEVKNTFHSFIISIFKATVWIVLLMIFLQILKVPLSPLVAVLGTLGLGIGLALKDHMANIAGGIMIAVNKQFSVGDYIKCADAEGFVEGVELFFTRIKTMDNKVIFVPNAVFTNNVFYNYTKENMRRVDISIGVSYSSSVEAVKDILLALMDSNEMIKKEPAAFAGVTGFGDSSVNLTVRAWTDTSNYWDVYFYINETLKKEFDKKGIEIPFPQLDVHTA